MPRSEAIAVGFPGQGGDWLAALRTIEENRGHQLVRALFDALGRERLDPADQEDVRVSQPVIFVAGLVATDEHGLRPDSEGVRATIGHSLGELTACAFAGAISWSDGLDLACRRGELSHQTRTRHPGSMLLVAGIDSVELDWLRRRAEHVTSLPLDVAVVNGTTQFVLAGADRVVDVCLDLAASEGVRARRLPIGGAFHSSLMVSEVPEFEEAVRAVHWHDPVVPVIMSTTGSAPDHPARDLPALLARAFVMPVLWQEAVAHAATLGIRRIIDAGPGDTIVRLGRLGGQMPVATMNG